MALSVCDFFCQLFSKRQKLSFSIFPFYSTMLLDIAAPEGLLKTLLYKKNK
jgi:hypothetical protein